MQTLLEKVEAAAKGNSGESEAPAGINPPVPEGGVEPPPMATQPLEPQRIDKSEQTPPPATGKRKRKTNEQADAEGYARGLAEGRSVTNCITSVTLQQDPPGMIVAFDCIPMGQDFKYLHDLIREPAELVAQRNEVPHWGLVEFGQGGARLAIAVDAYLKENPYSGVVLVNSFSTEAKALQAVLIEHASLVVRGLK